ncbi:3837_t:CDS:2, partial [Gigaspora margarita]
QQLENIITHIQNLAAVLKSNKLILLNRNQEDFGRKNSCISVYLQDLNHGDPQEPILPLEVPRRNWDEKLVHCCQAIINLNPRTKTNAKPTTN